MTYIKYKAKKTTIDGITFDSKKEAKRYAELKLLERAGEIQDLELQKRFEILPALIENGKTINRAVYYVADFVYRENRDLVVEDVKGYRTDVYQIKKKMFEYKYAPIRIKEI